MTSASVVFKNKSYTPTDIWVNLRQPVSPGPFCRHHSGRMLFSGSLSSSWQNCWSSFKWDVSSFQVQLSTAVQKNLIRLSLGFWEVNSWNLIYPVRNQLWCLRPLSCVQVSTAQLLVWGEAEECGGSTSSLWPQHDAATTMPDSWDPLLPPESLTLTPPSILLLTVSKKLVLCLIWPTYYYSTYPKTFVLSLWTAEGLELHSWSFQSTGMWNWPHWWTGALVFQQVPSSW